MRAGIIGCGVISDIYLKNLTGKYTNPQVVACADLFGEKAKERAEKYSVQAMSVEKMLADPEIDIILNLTTPMQHAEISKRALENGKHVYCEKPLAVTLEDGEELLKYAQEKGLQIGCAPDTFLGAGVQTACRILADGWIGNPVAATAFVTSRGHERWHGNPGFYYQKGGGPHFDMGPYYVTVMVAAFGSVKRVIAMSKRTFDKRTVSADGPMHGAVIPVEVDTHFSASLEFENGVVATLLMSFDIWATGLPRMEIYGTSGTLSVPDPNTFDGPVKIRSMYDTEFRETTLLNPYRENSRGLGLAQMCRAIEKNEEICANGELALHVLEVLCAIDQAGRTKEEVLCHTSCRKPPMLPQGILETDYGF